MPRDHRLVTQADRSRCLTQGRRQRIRTLDFSWLDNSVGHPRMGLIVPKFQSSAVARNRLRRRLLEIWRRSVQGNQGARDLVIKTRREAYAASFEELRETIAEFAARVFRTTGNGQRVGEDPGAGTA